jgi:hypothetical protein
MPEQLALDQGLDDGGAIDRHERTRSTGSLVDGLAASSLPVPVSPVMKTETLAGATRSITSMIRRIGTDWPIMTNPNRPLDS